MGESKMGQDEFAVGGGRRHGLAGAHDVATAGSHGPTAGHYVAAAVEHLGHGHDTSLGNPSRDRMTPRDVATAWGASDGIMTAHDVAPLSAPVIALRQGTMLPPFGARAMALRQCAMSPLLAAAATAL
jgi:hypothetical protein